MLHIFAVIEFLGSVSMHIMWWDNPVSDKIYTPLKQCHGAIDMMFIKDKIFISDPKTGSRPFATSKNQDKIFLQSM
ncbi:MAG: hypothetical protein IPF68_00775 [Bacteroidales bacterium]|nr:hypothetical protein [Bacteroidales bacterium]